MIDAADKNAQLRVKEIMMEHTYDLDHADKGTRDQVIQFMAENQHASLVLVWIHNVQNVTKGQSLATIMQLKALSDEGGSANYYTYPTGSGGKEKVKLTARQRYTRCEAGMLEICGSEDFSEACKILMMGDILSCGEALAAIHSVSGTSPRGKQMVAAKNLLAHVAAYGNSFEQLKAEYAKVPDENKRDLLSVALVYLVQAFGTEEQCEKLSMRQWTNNQITTITWVLDQGVDLDPNPLPQGLSALIAASRLEDHAWLITRLLDAHANIDAVHPATGCTAVHFVVMGGDFNVAMLKALLERNYFPDLSIRDKRGLTPLALAAVEGHEDMYTRLAAFRKSEPVWFDANQYLLDLEMATDPSGRTFRTPAVAKLQFYKNALRRKLSRAQRAAMYCWTFKLDGMIRGIAENAFDATFAPSSLDVQRITFDELSRRPLKSKTPLMTQLRNKIQDEVLGAYDEIGETEIKAIVDDTYRAGSYAVARLAGIKQAIRSRVWDTDIARVQYRIICFNWHFSHNETWRQLDSRNYTDQLRHISGNSYLHRALFRMHESVPFSIPKVDASNLWSNPYKTDVATKTLDALKSWMRGTSDVVDYTGHIKPWSEPEYIQRSIKWLCLKHCKYLAEVDAAQGRADQLVNHMYACHLIPSGKGNPANSADRWKFAESSDIKEPRPPSLDGCTIVCNYVRGLATWLKHLRSCSVLVDRPFTVTRYANRNSEPKMGLRSACVATLSELPKVENSFSDTRYEIRLNPGVRVIPNVFNNSQFREELEILVCDAGYDSSEDSNADIHGEKRLIQARSRPNSKRKAGQSAPAGSGKLKPLFLNLKF
mgnify:CR=1 FL=1